MDFTDSWCDTNFLVWHYHLYRKEGFLAPDSKVFCSLTKLKPYSPASSTLDEKGGGRSSVTVILLGTKWRWGPSWMSCATCLKRFMGWRGGKGGGARAGEYSLHTGEVSEKYHTSSLENPHTKEVNSLIPELQSFKKNSNPRGSTGKNSKMQYSQSILWGHKYSKMLVHCQIILSSSASFSHSLTTPHV